MPLSEYEQRVLEQLEHDLGQDASLHRALTRGPRASARVVAAAVGVLVGLTVVIFGVVTHLPLLGIAGFVIMAGVALWALLAPTKPAVPESKGAPTAAMGPRGKSSRSKSSKDFMGRMEERFERRREQGEI